MKCGKWNVYFEFGWFKGNTLVGFLFEIGKVIEDYPSGWLCITILGIQVGKFCIEWGISK